MIVKNIHEKLLRSIQEMLIDTKVNLPYYGEFNLHINFKEQESVGTCGVNVSSSGMNFFYSPSFLENMSQKEVNFITLHEDFHLLFNHPRRTMAGQYDHRLSNIAQDMIINHLIWEDISHTFVEIPKTKEGKNMALFIPKEYTGKLIFEELYEWLKEEKEKWDKSNKSQNQCKSCDGSGEEKGKGESKGKDGGEGDGEGDGQSCGGSGNGKPCQDCNGTGNEGGKDSTGKPSYGPYGKNPSKNGEPIDTWSKEQIFDDIDKNGGEYLDKHMGDDVPEEMREAMVRDIMDRLESRGLTSGDIETTLNKLRKKRKDYLKEIKRSVSTLIFGTKKQKTIVKPNRKGISGLKGNRKVKTKINVILDTSGSMSGSGTFERVLSYVYQNDIEINFIQSDTEVKWVENFKSKRKLETMKIHGLGGTAMTPAIEYVIENYNDYASVLLTDGFTDSLDTSRLKKNLLIISVGVPCPITRSNGKTKQITIENTH
jgi:predicted metal-dependent peptidase